VAGERIVDSGLAAAALSEGDSPLTAHEHEVLVASREHATAQVAAALHLSPGATRNHLSAITGKLGIGSRIEALRVAEDKGWL
jgi:two-component system response regulator DesR